jgi:hypothetical protein
MILCGLFPLGVSTYAAEPCPESLNGQGFSVIYAGGSLGYFRSPDHQSSAVVQPAGAPSSAAIQAERLIGALCGPDKQLVISMGNQFAPQIISRVLYPAGGGPVLYKGREYTCLIHLRMVPLGWRAVMGGGARCNSPALSVVFQNLGGCFS